jgi:predicted dehydrogenase
VDIFRKIKKIINVDQIHNIEANYLWGRKEKLFGWRSKTKNYSLTLGAAIHMIDLVNWLIEKKPTHVFSKGNKIATKNSVFKKNSIISYFFTYKNNLTVKITADGVCVHPHFHELKIFEKSKTIYLDMNNQIIIKKKGKSHLKEKIIANYPDKKNRKKLIQEFITFLNNKKKIKIYLNLRIKLIF